MLSGACKKPICFTTTTYQHWTAYLPNRSEIGWLENAIICFMLIAWRPARARHGQHDFVDVLSGNGGCVAVCKPEGDTVDRTACHLPLRWVAARGRSPLPTALCVFSATKGTGSVRQCQSAERPMPMRWPVHGYQVWSTWRTAVKMYLRVCVGMYFAVMAVWLD